MVLSGIRVLDLSGRSGLLAGRLLAGFGAEVLRPRSEIAETERVFGAAGRAYYEWGKNSIDLTLRDMGAIDAVAETADIVLDGTLASGETVDLVARHPHLVGVRITPFGESGSRRDWSGSDLVCASRAGMVFVNGYPESPPLQPFGTQAYHAAGIWAAIAALVSLRARRLTGRGQSIDLAVQAAAAAAVEHVTGLRRQGRDIQRRQGTLHWSRVFRTGPTRDGLVLHTTAGNWPILALWVNEESHQPELLAGELDEVAVRRDRCEELFDRLDRWSSSRLAREIEEEGQKRRLTFAEVRRPERLASDPQLAARGFSAERVGEFALPGPPFLLERTPFRSAATCSGGGLRKQTEVREASVSSAVKPLEGLRVLDFTWVVAGPVTTRILADQGASVIKIEHPQAPDFGTRRGGLSGNLNRGKQSVALDMETSGGREIARRLVRESDVVIDNFSARVMENWGLDYRGVCALRPDIVQVRLSGFGLNGPEKDRVSYGPTLQAMAGIAHLMKHADGAPAGWGYSWSDMAAGLMGAFATLAALHHRDQTGEGQLVDLGQYGNLVSLLGPGVCDLLAGRSIQAPGNECQEGVAVPHGIFRSADEARADGGSTDRWLAIAVLSEDHWQALAGLLAEDGEGWARSEGYATLERRREASSEISQRIGDWVRVRRAEDLESRLQAVGIPSGLVADGDDLAEDAQLLERGYFPRVKTPEGNEEVFDGIPFVASDFKGSLEAAGPLLGEHGEDVLSKVLGMTAAEIAELHAEGVIVCHEK